MASLTVPKFLQLPKFPAGSLPATVVDLTKAQGDLALASQLHVLADGMQKKIAAETTKLATLKADADGALKKSCQLLGDGVPGCVASKLKGQQSTIEGFSATLKGMVEFEQTLNKGILATFAKNGDKTCAILAKTASDVATQKKVLVVLDKNLSALATKVAELQAGKLQKGKHWSLPAGTKAPTKASMGIPCKTAA